MATSLGTQNTTTYPIKKKIFKEGEPAKKLYLIKSGEVLCLKSANDRLIPVYRAVEGDILGESAMTQDGVYNYSAITASHTELIEINASQFTQIFAKSPGWLIDLTKTMIHRFENTANLVAENRLIHPSITSEDQFTSSLEIEFKKILS